MFNSATYLLLRSRDGRLNVAIVIIVLACIYAVVTVFWRDPAVEALAGPLTLTVLDNAFIAAWMWATGGFSSPYFVLFFAEAAASVTRFDLVRGIVAMAISAVVYLAIILLDGGGPAYEVTVRTGYILVVGVLAAYMVEVIRRSERDAASAEASVESFQELTKLKNNFVSNVSHELRTPLTAIRGAASTLSRHDDRLEPDSRRELVEMIDRQSEGLDGLIEDLIDIGLVDEGRLVSGMMTTDLAPLVGQDVAAVEQESGRTIERRMPEFGIKLRCDANKVVKAVHKLVENAIKFSEQGTPVRVTMDDHPEKIRISVIDQGVGIPDQQLEQIFDRFYQVDGSATRDAAGTGVGLTIAHEIVRLHGGQIEVESRKNVGSTFTLVFPKKGSETV
ncbi:MAG: two-component system, OmpR family, phosphate regulon sensor histidine kinase PhoR [Actinomycetota bacterium]|nr:two-component system, OmpR family, phosphate regulon sensor histidine kinase PhoR [Actinomycetota bacterium]